MINGNVTFPQDGADRSLRDVTAGSSMMLLPFRIERQAQLRPDDVAVECGDRQITYGQLNRISGRIARRLRSSGVGAGDVVAVLAERGALLPVALVGVWKAGAAYLPLDPAYPAGRLEFMLRDSGAKAVMAERALEARLPALSLPVLIAEDIDAEQVGMTILRVPNAPRPLSRT